MITDPAKIRAVFEEGTICRLAMIDGDEPYIVPLNYGWHEETLWFHSAAGGRKVRILEGNPFVAYEIETGVELAPGENACDWGCRFRTVMGTGRVEFITDAEEKRKALRAIMRQQTGREGWEFPDRALEKTLCLKLKPGTVSGKTSGYGEFT